MTKAPAGLVKDDAVTARVTARVTISAKSLAKSLAKAKPGQIVPVEVDEIIKGRQ